MGRKAFLLADLIILILIVALTDLTKQEIITGVILIGFLLALVLLVFIGKKLADILKISKYFRNK